MSVQTLQLKPVVSVAAVMRVVKAPLKVPAWAVVTVLIMVGLYGYVAGRQNPIHHYVPYVGYPLVMDSTTGKACYSSQPKPADDSAAAFGTVSAETSTGPTIPLCGKE
jgi:hypothetical protein